MNQIDGSYLLHESGKRIISNIECLGEISDNINAYRLETGKED